MFFYRLMVSIHIILCLCSRTLAQASVEVTGAPQGCHEGFVRMSQGRYGMLARALLQGREGVMTCSRGRYGMLARALWHAAGISKN